MAFSGSCSVPGPELIRLIGGSARRLPAVPEFGRPGRDSRRFDGHGTTTVGTESRVVRGGGGVRGSVLGHG